MSVLLTCDSCGVTTFGIIVHGRVTGPGTWWVQPSRTGIVCACSEAHLLDAQFRVPTAHPAVAPHLATECAAPGSVGLPPQGYYASAAATVTALADFLRRMWRRFR